MTRKMKTMDGNNAAAWTAYAFSEVAAIYPITPSSSMASLTYEWAAENRKNIFGQSVKTVEMQSEGGVAGAVHGSLSAGALTTTFTASQGLLLMLPDMYKMAGELLPSVIHVSARSVATHALCIFGDHSDVYAARQTGYAMLCSDNPQEIMDLSAVAHLSAIKGSVPFLHFFDGFRSSHQIDKISVWDYDDLRDMLDFDALLKFRKRALNPERPILKGSAQNPDIFFQNREAANICYLNLPDTVQKYMDEVNKRTGKNYSLVNYYGAPDAQRVIVAMGSVCDTVEETVDYLNAKGEKVGLVKVHLYRPFPKEAFIRAVPASCTRIAVLDRTKEPGAPGEPLYLDVSAAYTGISKPPMIIGGRYGLGSKDTLPSDIAAVYDNLEKETPLNGFTLSIIDDVTNLSLPRKKVKIQSENTACKFWGLGSDGTVGANKNSIKIIGDNTKLYVQAYFSYDSKKSGGITVSHLRFGKQPIKSSYLIDKADFVACHSPSYIDKYSIVEDLVPGGIFLLNCPWDENELSEKLPKKMRRYIAENGINFYTVDASAIASEIGLGNKISVILQSAFFYLTDIIDYEKASYYMKEAVKKTFSSKGEDIVGKNISAVSLGVKKLKKINVPEKWKSLEVDDGKNISKEASFVGNVLRVCEKQDGNLIPVSSFSDMADGHLPLGTSKYEKRGIAVNVPVWDSEKCIMCNRCSVACPHAVIRPTVMNEEETAKAPADMKMKKMAGKGYDFAIVISVLDCTGCLNCVSVCPDKARALSVNKLENEADKQKYFDYAISSVSEKTELLTPVNARNTQFKTPLLEFSGACAGCGETPYAKLITQICGDKAYISNATGCSSIWGGSAPFIPYTKNKFGKGPAWANSLFEDNAEHGLGIRLGAEKIRERLSKMLSEIDDEQVSECYKRWLETYSDADENEKATDELTKALKLCKSEKARAVLNEKEFLSKKIVWIIGGDGWAYDIGFGGLDHVVATGEDVNVFVFDTEVYSNTGGQASKATPKGAIAEFASQGKEYGKKNLAGMLMTYGYVYVAQVALGYDMNQTVKAIKEAVSYNGPSVIIGYAPCINHGVKQGLKDTQGIIKNAVLSGYWKIFRYDPRLKNSGKPAFISDSGEAEASYCEFLMNELRYSALKSKNPERAEKLFAEAKSLAKEKYEQMKRINE